MSVSSVLAEIRSLQGAVEKGKTQWKDAHGINDFIFIFTNKFKLFSFFP